MWVGEVQARLNAFSEAVRKLAERAHMEQRHIDHVLARLQSLEQRILSHQQNAMGAFIELLALEIEINADLGEL
ncbi:MAG: hypothetical protein V3U43_00335 [Pseudomonadales bacterium]